MASKSALPNDDLRSAVAHLEVEVEASLAIARATLMALASLSPVVLRSAEAALARECEAEPRSEAVAAMLRDCREQLLNGAPQDRSAGALEKSLIVAADVLAARTGGRERDA